MRVRAYLRRCKIKGQKYARKLGLLIYRKGNKEERMNNKKEGSYMPNRGENIYEDIIETVREPLLVLNSDLRASSANRSFYDSFKVIS